MNPLHLNTRATLAGPVEFAGLGLFTAAHARLRLLPRQHDNPVDGLVFRINDVDIPARIQHQAQLPILPGRCTVLANHTPPHAAITTEHVLSALTGLGVTDATLELYRTSHPPGDPTFSVEVPILDGSAQPFTSAIRAAGLRTIDGPPLEPLTLREPITVTSPDGSASITAAPRAEPGCSYTYHLDYGPAAALRPQTASITLTPALESAEAYARHVAPARTFCLKPEADALRAAGLFAHLTPRDMLVLASDGTPIDNTLRFDNEPARHKLLDLIGDLALVGRPIQLDITARRAGHALNHALARALLAAR